MESLLGGPHASVGSAAGVAREARRPARPALEKRDETRIAEQSAQAPQLVVHQRIHGIQDKRPHCGPLTEGGGASARLAGQFAEDRQKERLGLAGPGAGHDDEISTVDQAAADGFRLVHVGWVVDQPGQVALWIRDSAVRF